MSNIIQNYTFKDISIYKRNYKVNLDQLNAAQNNERKGRFAAVDIDEAASVEISELAKSMYTSSKNAEQRSADVAEKTVESEDTTNSKYPDMSNAEREVKELEEYISSHSVDTSIDSVRNGSLLSAAMASKNLTDNELSAAEKEYMDSLGEIADKFIDISGKVTYGNYSSNDITVDDLNFSALDELEEKYQSYKDSIGAIYSGDERQKYMDKLDEVYNSVFEEKVINPVKSTYDDKLTFFKPDDEDTMRSIKASSSSMESLQNMISGYLTSQSVNKTKYEALSEGTKSFYEVAENKETWHNTEMLKNTLEDTMTSYSAVKEVKTDSSEYYSAKAAADAISKKISDQYAENVNYKLEKYGLIKNGENVEENNDTINEINKFITNSSSGLYMIDFQKIENLNELLENK